MEINPYRSPVEQPLVEVVDLPSGRLRARFENEEMTVLAVGWFYYFLGSLLAAISVILSGWSFLIGETSVIFLGVMGLITGAVYIITGYGLRRFDVWARSPSIVAALVAIAIPPAGLLAGAVCFYLLRKNAVREIFTLQYQTAIIEEGEIEGHYGWVAVVGGLLSAVTLSLLFFLLIEGFL